MAKKNDTLINKKFRASEKADQVINLGENNNNGSKSSLGSKYKSHNKVSPVSSGTGVEPPFMELKNRIKAKKIKK